ncbi:MAG: transporter [Candidatus Euphemobacter frigidus]|nr:transporter [Candidatus Euphemobacter frigidus]MDP8276170.1 transporter [Candidatus Euphemobacter frigidus]
MVKKVCWAIALVLLLLPAVVEAQVSPDARLLQKAEWDGAVVTGPWLRGQFRYQKFDKIKGWGLGPTYAMCIPNLERLEVGGRFWFLSMKPDGGSNESGMSDIDLWGKYQFLDDPLLLSGGIMFTLPTGSEKVIHPWASGELNFELFGALRYYITDIFALIGHMGLRINGDADKKVGGQKIKYEGETQFELGAGMIYQVAPELNLLTELNLATEAYKDMDNDIELTGGAEYLINEMLSLEGGIGVGLDDGAPDFEVIVQANVLF